MRTVRIMAAMAAALATGAAHAATPAPLRIATVDVEGGSAILFVTPEGRSLLVDTGFPTGEGLAPGTPPTTPDSVARIKAAAASLGVTRIDYLLVTHYHRDHVGSVAELMAAMPVDTVIDHGDNREAPAPGSAPSPAAPVIAYPLYLKSIAGHRRISPKAGDSLAVGSLRLTFVDSGAAVTRALPQGGQPTPGCADMPDMGPDGGLENAMSLGFVATFGTTRIATLGDTTWNVEKALVCPINRIGPVDLWFVSHHGSALSNSPQLIAALHPRVAIMNNGPRKGGDAAVLERLASASGKPALWQSHLPLRSPALATDAARIANLTDVPDAANALIATVDRAGTVTVENRRNGHAERYPRP